MKKKIWKEENTTNEWKTKNLIDIKKNDRLATRALLKGHITLKLKEGMSLFKKNFRKKKLKIFFH